MKQVALVVIVFIAFCTKAFSQTIDSTYSEIKTNGIWQKNELDITTRNPDCAVTAYLQMIWDTNTHSWVNSFLSTYPHDAENVVKAVTQSWDPLNNKWINYSRSFFTDSALKKIYVYQLWDAGSNAWINNYRFVDGNDDMGRTLASEFDLYSNNQWQRIQRSLISYNVNNFVDASTFQVWMNNAWINNSKTTYDYTGKGLTNEYYWNIGNNTWVLSSHIFNKYIPGTFLSEKALGQILSDTNWQNNFHSANSYNNKNLELSSFQQNWDVNNNSWVNSSKASFDYYDDNNSARANFENWDTNTNSWSTGFKVTYTDVSCSASIQLVPVVAVKNNSAVLQKNRDNIYLIHPIPHAETNNSIEKRFNPMASNANRIVYDISFNNNQQQTQQNAFELIISFGENVQRINKATATNAIDMNKHSFVLSPNPAKNYFNIDLSVYKNESNIILKLSDMNGKIIIQQKVNSAIQKIDLPSSLQKGIYAVTIILGRETHTKKLVVE